MADYYIADTSVWVDHFKTRKRSDFGDLLARQRIYLHTLVYGELLLGGISRSPEIKNLLTMLPRSREASFEEVNNFIESQQLQNLRIGWVDAALLASALLTGCSILTHDQALQRAAQKHLKK